MPTKNKTPAVVLGEHLTRLHVAAGKPGWKHIEKEMYLLSGGSVNVTDQTIANYHHGKQDPSKAAIGTLVGLWIFYNCDPDDLGPVAGRLIREFLAFTNREHASGTPGWLGGIPESVAA